MKITIHQTKQIKQFEPRRIEVTIDTLEENLEGNWEDFVEVVIESIDRLLYPENYGQIGDAQKIVDQIPSYIGSDLSDF